MIRSLLDQKRQINSSKEYKDLNYIDGAQGVRELSGNVHDPIYSEAVSNLEQDLNNLRSQIRDIIGRGTWYAEANISLEEINNLIQVKENELILLKKHEELFHSSRESDTFFIYNLEDNISEILVYKPNSTDKIQETLFTYILEVLSKITKTVWDNDLNIHIKTEKELIFDINSRLIEIKNTLL